ncbi:hypothetical protein EWM64_g5485 [Hericium alpestre]|uniref:Fcf2 pre-rRNA processing C-terminal domain-containing protein n=1 Tax=Hericium alpestre TaxID=135208 RepID=A0A4Y9ZUH7_9AGAM|nr:hypothetical protein EWM64_g5485 [Hericium alpestre]
MTSITTSPTTTPKGKGKAKALPSSPLASPSLPAAHESSESSTSSSASSSDSSSASDSDFDDSDSEDEITQEYLDSLLEKARQNILAKQGEGSSANLAEDFTPPAEEDILLLGDAKSEQQKLPALDPGRIPKPYITLGATRRDPSSLNDPDAERTAQSTSSLKAPAPPLPPPELTNSGKPLTKKEKKALKNKTAGPDWFDLPAPAEADLPRLHREVEALRLRNQLDPKRFYRKEEGEGKGIKGLPKHFAIGTIIPTSMPFGTTSGDNLSRAERKRTLVDELVDDAEARRYAKRKFSELQTSRGKTGRGTLHAKKMARKPKW